MSSNSQQFAVTVLQAIKAAGHHTDEEIGDAGGPSTTTMAKLRKVAEGQQLSSLRNDTLKRIDKAANWPAGTAQRLWHGGGEAPPPKPQLRAVGPREPDLASRVGDLEVRLRGIEERLDRLLEVSAPTPRVALKSSERAGDPEDD